MSLSTRGHILLFAVSIAAVVSLARRAEAKASITNGVIELDVYLAYPATTAAMSAFTTCANEANDILVQSTIGQLRLGTVSVTTSPRDRDDSALAFMAAAGESSHVSPLALGVSPTTLVVNHPDGVPFVFAELGAADCGARLAHAIGHAVLGLHDDETPHASGTGCMMAHHDAVAARTLCSACWDDLKSHFGRQVTVPTGTATRAFTAVPAPTIVNRAAAPTDLVILANNAQSMGAPLYASASLPVCPFQVAPVLAGQCVLSKLHYAQAAVQALFKLFPGLPNSPSIGLGAYSFDDAVHEVSSFDTASASYADAEAGIGSLSPGHAGSSVGNALEKAATLLADRDHSGRRSVFLVSGKYSATESPRPRDVCSRLLADAVEVYPVWSDADDVDDIFARSSGDSSLADLAVDIPPLMAAHTTRALDGAILVPTSRFVLTPFKEREETAAYAAFGQVDEQGNPVGLRPVRARAEARFRVPDGSGRLFIVATEATTPARPFGLRVTLRRGSEVPRDVAADPAFRASAFPGTIAAAFDIEPGDWTLRISQPDDIAPLSYVEGSFFVGVEDAPVRLATKVETGPHASIQVAVIARVAEEAYALEGITARVLAPDESEWHSIDAVPDAAAAGDRFLVNIGSATTAGVYLVSIAATYASRHPEQTEVDRFDVSASLRIAGAPMLLISR